MPAATVTAQPIISPENTARDREGELWLALPKGGKTLGGSDDAFLARAGLRPAERSARVDDYLLNSTREQAMPVRAWVSRPKDALRDIADGGMDAAVVGRDVLKEFNASLPEGTPKIKEMLDLDMASCVLTLAVPVDSPVRCLADFNGAVIGTKYDDSLRAWATRNGITLRDIVKREGAIESLPQKYPSITAICDIVESGSSLVANGLVPFGISDDEWAPICRGDVRFSDLPAATLGKIPGVVTISSAVLVRTPATLPAAKERALNQLAARFFDASTAIGHVPAFKVRAAERTHTALSQESRLFAFPGHARAFRL